MQPELVIGDVWFLRENPNIAVTISDVISRAQGTMVRGVSIAGRVYQLPVSEWVARLARTPSEAAFPMTRVGDILPAPIADLELHERLQAAELAPKVPEDF